MPTGHVPTPPELEARAARVFVTRTFPDKTEAHDEQVLEVRSFAVPPAYVNAQVARTINLGNYESLKVQVGVSLPCYAEEVDRGMPHAVELCVALLDKEMSDLETAPQ